MEWFGSGNLEIERDDRGRIMACKGYDNGLAAELSVIAGVRDRESWASISLSRAGDQFLNVEGTVSVPDERVTFEARSDQFGDEPFSMGYAVDFARYDTTHLLFISGLANANRVEHRLEGTYDLLHRQGSVNLNLDYWLPTELKLNLKPFAGPLNEMRFRVLNDSLVYRDVIEDIVANSVWKAAGRAACWGLAGGAGAAAGLATSAVPPLAVILTGTVIGAAASVCNDRFKD
jgi:hypothetical protein